MPTYTQGKPEVRGLVEQVMQKFHAELTEAEVTIGLLMAHPNEDEEHALKLHGYPCAATVKVTPYKQRVQGVEDAVITIDARTWADLLDPERIAVLDHELHHLEVARDKDGQIKADDHGRPKLKVKLHDWQLGGFATIAGRHGGYALEVQAFHAVHKAFHQQIFAWSDDSATPANGFSDVPGNPLKASAEVAP